jgi:protein-L-isoaspartate(D-aspartate) O-methyltransferase
MSETLQHLLGALQREGIADPRVLDAIARVPREAFISDAELRAHAYANEALPIECEQTISQPFIVAYMTERLHLAPDIEVLEIGTGSGYQAAILSLLARHVYTIECHLELHRLALKRFAQLGLANITALHGDGTKGWPGGRLFERIIVTAGTDEVPAVLMDQLAPGGLMVVPLGRHDTQRITLISRSNGRLTYQPLIPVRFVPLLPDGD